LLSGEAGIGKSRLTAQLAAEVASEPHTRLRYQCSPDHRDSVLHPFVVQLGRVAPLAADDPAETQLKKLEAITSTPQKPVDPQSSVALRQSRMLLQRPSGAPSRTKRRNLQVPGRQRSPPSIRFPPAAPCRSIGDCHDLLREIGLRRDG
jgi:predicted ATPase